MSAAPTAALPAAPGEKAFFVYARSGIKGPAFLLGPFETKEAADPHVDRCRDLAEERDPWAVHYEFGVAGVPKAAAWTIKPLFGDGAPS